MPLWKIYHPVGAYDADDKQEFSTAITSIYEVIPIPKFYVVVLFEEVEAGNVFVGGNSHDKFIRICIDQMARTLPGAVVRESPRRRNQTLGGCSRIRLGLHHQRATVRPVVATGLRPTAVRVARRETLGR
jgi:phenylpyruvate tautomerase PptA (4-oxalocrotonate tautomerase family)